MPYDLDPPRARERHHHRADHEPGRQRDAGPVPILEDDVARPPGRDLQRAARPGRHSAAAAAAFGLHVALRAAPATEGVMHFGGRYDGALTDRYRIAVDALHRRAP